MAGFKVGERYRVVLSSGAVVIGVHIAVDPAAEDRESMRAGIWLEDAYYEGNVKVMGTGFVPWSGMVSAHVVVGN